MAQPLRKKPGPKKTGQGVQIQVRVHKDLLGLLDDWAAAQEEPNLTRPEVIRRLLRQALGEGSLSGTRR